MSENIKEAVKETTVKKAPSAVPAQPKVREMTSYEMEQERRDMQEKELYREFLEDSQMVRGIFNFKECPRGKLTFSFHKYKWDPIKTYELQDGELYEIPLMVAKHLNTGCWYPTYNYQQDERGLPKVSFNEKVRRTSFQNLDFVDRKDPSMRAKLAQTALSGLKIMGSALPQ